jgi:hypothetical protein
MNISDVVKIVLVDKIKKNHEAFTNALKKYLVDKITLNQFYITNDGSKIDAVYSDEFSVYGVIVESKCKGFIGFHNIFHWDELTAV